MATTSSGAGQRPGGYHQDYIARVRHANALPAPDMPPRLLTIAGEGLSGGAYVTPSFASRLAREQPINIEADAELGMAIDLVGMPGIFDGDETSIQAPERMPVPHPNDRSLLRPLASLGKPSNASVSFLRRTEYISSEQGGRSRGSDGPSSRMIRTDEKAAKKRKIEIEEQNEPEVIRRHVQKSFYVANPDEGADGSDKLSSSPMTSAEREAWATPKHPSNKKLTPLDFYPVLPDLDAFPDSGGYVVFTYNPAPLSCLQKYDNRIDVALLRPRDPQRPGAMAMYEEARARHEQDPSRPPPGAPPFDYDFYAPDADDNAVARVQAKFDPENPQWQDSSLYTHHHEGKGSFRYTRIRTYATSSGNQFHNKWKEVVLTLNDGPEDGSNGQADGHDDGRRSKGAYLYPVLTRSTIRPQRNITQNVAGLVSSSQPAPLPKDPDRVDQFDVRIGEPEEDERMRREAHKQELEGVIDGEQADAEDAEAEVDAPGEEDD